MTVFDLPPWFWMGVGVSLGLAFGSFLNVVIYRLPRGENIAFPASHCTSCGTPIRAFDNIPLLGWLLLRGRARCCKAPISPRYPLVELLGGLLGGALVQVNILTLPLDTPLWQGGLLFAAYLALGLGLIAAAFIDLSHMYLPDEITLGGALLGVLTVPLRPDATWLGSLIGAGVGFVLVWLPFDLLHRLLRGKPGMGLGDAKLVMLAGAWFGWEGALFALFGGAVQAVIGVIVSLLRHGKLEEPEAVKLEREELARELEKATPEERAQIEAELAGDPLLEEPEDGLGKSRIAFGPFLVLATLELLVFGGFIRAELMETVFNP
ncbi:MAG TPA: prepilin peptidase [Polyangiaceae bacterium]|nr:prepilin peptidase [Polyangiaceae bacterium]